MTAMWTAVRGELLTITAAKRSGIAAGAAVVMYLGGATFFEDFSTPWPVVLLGLIIGMTYGILSVGLVLVYRANKIVNFAHGEVGAFAAALFGVWVVTYDLPYWVVFPAVLAIAAGISALIEVAAVRRLRNAPPVMSIVVTLAISQVLLLMSFAVNTQIRSGAVYPQPSFVPQFDVGGVLRVTPAYSAMLIFTPVIVVGLVLFLRFTRYGIGIRAASDNRDAAIMAGISAPRMSSIAWGLAGAVAAYTAILQFPQQGFVVVGASLGPALLTRALVAAVVARMTNLPTALGMGVAIGVIEQVMLWNSPGGGQVEVILFAIMLFALLFQSRGSTRERAGSWTALTPWEPLPERIRRLPSVRLLGPVTALAVAGLLLLVLLTTNEASLVFALILGYALVGMSIYVVTGLGGQLSLGQFALAGIGAAASYHFTVQFGLWPLNYVAAGLAAAIIAVLIGLPALRIRGLMLAVVTLSFAVMAGSWLFQQPWMLGGGVAPGLPEFGDNAITTAKGYYLVALPIFAAGMFLVWNISRGGLRRSLVALRDNEDGARAFTIRSTPLKLQTFAVSGFIAGLGGAIYGHSLARIDATTFSPDVSITVVVFTVLGGLALLGGPLLGALFVLAVPAFVPLDAAGLAGSAIGHLLILLYFPGGLGGLMRPLRDRIVNGLAVRAGVVPMDTAHTSAHAQEEDEKEAAAFAASSEIRLQQRQPRPVRSVDGFILVGSHLTKSFGGIKATNDVSFKVWPEETIGIIGPNGAGKTTLFEIIGGFTAPDSGSLTFNGLDITRMAPERRAELGLVRSFQDARLFSTMTVVDAVMLARERSRRTRFLQSMLGLPGAGLEERRKQQRARELVHLMGLDRYRNKRINELSTGTRRIAEMACMIALSPRVLLLDEPSSGVAQRESEALGALLTTIKQRLRLTLVIIEHDMPLIMSISDQVVAMESGRVLKAGSPAEVRGDPAVIESYLGGDLTAIGRSGSVSEAAIEDRQPVAAHGHPSTTEEI